MLLCVKVLSWHAIALIHLVCARVLCCCTIAIPNPPRRAGWVELEEDDTIFKCVSVLQARAPTPAAGPSPPSASAGSARGHGLMEGLMGLKRWACFSFRFVSFCLACRLDSKMQSKLRWCVLTGRSAQPMCRNQAPTAVTFVSLSFRAVQRLRTTLLLSDVMRPEAHPRGDLHHLPWLAPPCTTYRDLPPLPWLLPLVGNDRGCPLPRAAVDRVLQHEKWRWCE